MTTLNTPEKILLAVGVCFDDLLEVVEQHDPRDGKLNTQPEFISALQQVRTLRALITNMEKDNG